MELGNRNSERATTPALALSHGYDPAKANQIDTSPMTGDIRPVRIPEPERGVSIEAVPLKTIFLHVTKSCNLSCCYCYFSANKPLPDEMTRIEFGRVWEDIVTLKPQRVVFTGGEPLLRKDILQLLCDLRDADPHHHVLRCLNNNGYLVTPPLAEELVGLVDEVRVSLDALAERNDALRGKGSFDAAVRALDYLHAVGFEPKVLVTVTSMSIPDLREFLCLLIAKGITRMNLNHFRAIGCGAEHPEWAAATSDIDGAVQQAWEECYPRQPVPQEPDNPAVHINCGVGSFISIMPNGDVFPCHELMMPEFLCGNVRQQSLTEICRRHSLLDKLRGLDFHQLARQDKNLVSLTGPDMCLGSVFARTRSLPVWRETLALRHLQMD